MIAHKCYRCGKLYESYNMDENYLEINAIYTLNRDTHKGGRHEHGPFDLCPDCSKELVNWLYKFSKEETEIEEEIEEKSAEIIDCRNCYFLSHNRENFENLCKVYNVPILYVTLPWDKDNYYLQPCRKCKADGHKNYLDVDKALRV